MWFTHLSRSPGGPLVSEACEPFARFKNPYLSTGCRGGTGPGSNSTALADDVGWLSLSDDTEVLDPPLIPRPSAAATWARFQIAYFNRGHCRASIPRIWACSSEAPALCTSWLLRRTGNSISKKQRMIWRHSICWLHRFCFTPVYESNMQRGARVEDAR